MNSFFVLTELKCGFEGRSYRVTQVSCEPTANSFAEKSMKQISISPIACLKRERAFSHSVREVWRFFFSYHTIKDRNTKKKNDQLE